MKEVVTMLKKEMQKLIAVLMVVGVAGYTSAPIIAEAAPQPPENAQEQRIEHHNEEQRVQRHKEEREREHQREDQEHHRREEQRRHHPKEDKNDHESHSDTGNLVTGLVIGGAIGAIVAHNT